LQLIDRYLEHLIDLQGHKPGTRTARHARSKGTLHEAMKRHAKQQPRLPYNYYYVK